MMKSQATPFLPLWIFPTLVGLGVISVVISVFIIYPILFYIFLGGIGVACQFAFNRVSNKQDRAAAIYRTVIALSICTCLYAEVLWVGIMIATHVMAVTWVVIIIMSGFFISLAIWGFSRFYTTISSKQWAISYLAALMLALASFAIWLVPFLDSFIECHTVTCYQTFTVTTFTGVLGIVSGLGAYFLALFLLLTSSLLAMTARYRATSRWFLSFVSACFWYNIRVLTIVWAISLLVFSLFALYTLPYIAIALVIYIIASLGQWLSLRGSSHLPAPNQPALP